MTGMATKVLIVPCPTCRQPSRFGPDNPWRPFCSERCRLIDLGKWFSEEHAISEPLKPGHFEEFAELPDDADPDQPDDKR